jgi:hypothetical protein
LYYYLQYASANGTIDTTNLSSMKNRTTQAITITAAATE